MKPGRANRSSPRAIALIASCIMAGGGAAAWGDSGAARRASGQMEDFVARGEYTAGARGLAEVDCSGDAACQTVVDFGYGWLYESWSAADPEQGKAFLARAQDYYTRAHKLSPDNTRVLTNLALVSRRLGDTEAAVASTRKVIALAPDDALQHYLFLGDTYSSAGDTADAIKAYRSAVELNPAHGVANQRLLEAFHRTDAYRDLFHLSQSIRPGLPELAATGFGYVTAHGFAQDPQLAERAFVNWAAIRADLGTLTPDSLSTLHGSSGWTSAGLKELAALIEADEPPRADEIAWWRQTPERRDAMARVLRLKAAALRAAAAGSDQPRVRMQLAMDYLKAAVEVAPPFEAYLHGDLATASNSRLDAASDLVALHHSIKAGSDLQALSGVSAGELEQMTDILFSGKAGAYASGQLSAIQRYHTVLGMIYYATGQVASNRADNATFQLEHAISVADEIARQDPSQYRPLPELQNMLADVYKRQGRGNDSARLSLDAAMGYLETDNLAEAGRALQQASSEGADPSRTMAVSTVLAGRLSINARDADVVQTTPGSSTVVLHPGLAWLTDPASLELPRRFVDGQRFKALADLGTLLSETGNADAARYVSAEALDAYVDQRTLLSPTDLRRLQNIDTSISRKAQDAAHDESRNISRGGAAQTSYRQEWSVPATGSQAITMNPEVLKKSREILQEEQAQKNIQFRRYEN
jgi:tetratricopeptide (TPR) repeat protein